MPSFDKFPIFVTGDRTENRPKCVFDKKSLALQSFRTLDFIDVSADTSEDDLSELKALAAEAQTELEAKLELKVQEAERRGQELGLQEAAKIHAEERQKFERRMEGAFSALNTALDKTEELCARDALHLGLKVAEKIARTTLVSNLDAITANIKEGLTKLEGTNDIKIVADEQLGSLLRDQSKAVFAELGIEGWSVETDNSLQPGDMILYRGPYSLDSRISSRLQFLEEALMKELGFDLGTEVSDDT